MACATTPGTHLPLPGLGCVTLIGFGRPASLLHAIPILDVTRDRGRKQRRRATPGATRTIYEMEHQEPTEFILDVFTDPKSVRDVVKGKQPPAPVSCPASSHFSPIFDHSPYLFNDS